MKPIQNKLGLTLAVTILTAASLATLGLAWPKAPALAAALVNQTFPLYVSYDPTGLDPATDQLYQNIENTLQGDSGYPNNRATFFSGYNADNGFTMRGWGAYITAVEPNGNGYLVTLSITPGLSSTTIGTICLIADLNYSEQYQVNNDGTFQYVASFDSNNAAGLVSTLIDGI